MMLHDVHFLGSVMNSVARRRSVSNFKRLFGISYLSKRLVLGIESTFDDTAAAVVNEDGEILGESIISQLAKHKSAGGVNPVFAQRMHQENLLGVVEAAMTQAKVNFKDLAALATATRPGLALSLAAGLDFSKALIAKHDLPFIPVHHMEAHALTVRIVERVDFPFLVLLASGGHCILCLAQGLGKYKILGQSTDEPPGAVFDKIAREMGLLTDQRFASISGGQAIEILASRGDESKMSFQTPLSIGRNNSSCNFSFSGLQTQVKYTIQKIQQEGALDEQTRCDIAAGFQKTIVKHISRHILRAVIFCKENNLIPSNSTLVLSGGVAANSYFRNRVSTLCENLSLRMICPPPRLCTDNGIMIAWAGMEYLKEGLGAVQNPHEVRYESKSPIGEYVGEQVIQAKIKLPNKLTSKMGISL